MEEAKEAEVIAGMQSIKDKVESKTFTIGAKAGTSGKIFGSVTTVQLAQVIQSDLEVEVDRRDIEMPEEEVKTLGEYTAQVKLHKKVVADIKFEVVAD